MMVIWCWRFYIGVTLFALHSAEFSHFDHHIVAPTFDESALHDDDFIEDSDHLREDIENAFGFFFGFSQENLEFSFFAIHDYDNNTKLDGLELMSALGHTHHHHKKEDNGANGSTSPTVVETVKHEEIAEIIKKNQDIVDRILKDDDVNNDGYISYPEYKISRQTKKLLKNKQM